MPKKQFIALFLGCLLLWSGNGWLPLLPVYAAQLGAKPSQIGNYLSMAYFALAAGSLIGGWLSDRLQRRRLLLVIGGAINVPLIWMMGRATNVWALAAFTAGCYFIASMAATLIYILAGLFAEPGKRGKIFAMLALTSPLMMLISSLVMGPIVERWGFRAMFSGFAVYACLFVLIGLLVQDKHLERKPKAISALKHVVLGKCYYLLVLGSILSSIAYFVSRLGISLAMKQMSFSVTAISLTGAVGGAVALPLLPMIGWLSDRIGGRRLLAFSFLAGTGCMLILAVAVFQWQFWLVAGLASIMLNSVNAVGSALVTDLVPRAALGRGMSLFNASTWIGGIIGFLGTGYAVQSFGMAPTFTSAALLPFIAMLLLIPIRRLQARSTATAAM